MYSKTKIGTFLSGVDPGCLFRIPDPDFYPSRIPDPNTATKERGEKKLVVITFYVAKNSLLLQNTSKRAVLAPGSGNYGSYQNPELCFEVQEIPVFPKELCYTYRLGTWSILIWDWKLRVQF
jgi:hypothetical protein